MEFGEQPDRTARAYALVLVTGLHVLVIWGLAAGLAGRQAAPVELPPVQAVIIEERSAPPAQLPPPPPLRLPQAPAATFVPPPEIRVRQPPRPSITAVTPVPAPARLPVRPAVPERRPQRRPPGVDAGRHCPEPTYPPISLRLGERGTVTLSFLIGTDGHVIESRVEQSSGHPRLDDAARRALARCRFTPGTVDGVPEQAWARIRYRWRIPESTDGRRNRNPPDEG